MKSVLIIANLCHASPRIPGLAKYLPQYGWAPVIVSPGLSEQQRDLYLFNSGRDLSIVETAGYSTGYGMTAEALAPGFVMKVIRGVWRRVYRRTVYPIVNYPDEERGWMPYCLSTISSLASSRRFDAILSSSSPVSCHLVAGRVASKMKIPWVADLRDPWTQNHAYPYGAVRRFFERRLEKTTLSRAAVLTTVSPQWASNLGVLHMKKTACLTNGYDGEIDVGSPRLTGKFTLTYAGNIYPRWNNTRMIVTAIDELIRDGHMPPGQVDLRFYGVPQGALVKELGALSRYIGDWISIHQRIPRRESYLRQQESQLLLLFGWDAVDEKGVVPSKLYEYLRARRPIVATGKYGGDFIEKVLDETKAGRYCRSLQETKEVLAASFLEFKDGGAVAYKGMHAEIERYSYKSIARQLASILDGAPR